MTAATPPQGSTPEPKDERRRGPRTVEGEFRRPLLEALTELGGRAPTHEVLHIVERKMKLRLTSTDYQELRAGEVRWRNTAKWERKYMKDEGLLNGTSRKGLWELTAKGTAELEKLRARS